LFSGQLIVDAPSNETIGQYLQYSPLNGNNDIEERIASLPADESFRLESVRITQDGEWAPMLGNGAQINVDISYQVLRKTTGLRVFIDLLDEEQNLLFRSFHDEDGDGIAVMSPGHYRSQLTIPADLLAPTRYQLCVLATVFNDRMCIPYPGLVFPLDIERTGRNNRAYFMEPIRGKLAPIIYWQTSFIGSK
jgi:hypothetical protein